MRIHSEKQNKTNGFTLIELVVAIGIFGIILVLMSNIVISVSKFALDNERRNDFISELDGAANIIKNDIRSAQELSVCSDNTLFRKSVDYVGTVEYYKLTTESDRLLWLQMNINCTTLPVGQTPKKIFLTSSETMKVDSSDPNAINITSAYDSLNSAQATNTLLYVRLTACSSDSIPAGGKIFDCVNNPYKYVFAISTRNVF